ncbi:hypothetical protein [Halorubrum sp. Atlit-28R]|uniref:hypothetical protein n=1 Tax=Halorubrum sp. Atlit-28R TaxID=2282129 RepID=UPI0018F50D91|nr:hypothetical protein [Halorubrum sp. Atlit-28R]
MIADADFCVEPTDDALTERLDATLGCARPPTSPVDHARQYDWDAIAEQAETTYLRVIDENWQKYFSAKKTTVESLYRGTIRLWNDSMLVESALPVDTVVSTKRVVETGNPTLYERSR